MTRLEKQVMDNNPFEFIKPFIATLYCMVDEPNNRSIIAWDRAGLCFEIKDK